MVFTTLVGLSMLSTQDPAVVGTASSMQGTQSPIVGVSSKVYRDPIFKLGDLLGPEDISVVNYVNERDGKLRLTEVARGHLRRVQTGGFISRYGMVVPGPVSPIRFKQGKIPTFLVTNLPLQQLPTKWECFVLNVRGSERFLPFLDEGFVDVNGVRGIHVRVAHYFGDVYKLRVEDLPPGEYAFKYGIDKEEKDLYCFGVESANPIVKK